MTKKEFKNLEEGDRLTVISNTRNNHHFYIGEEVIVDNTIREATVYCTGDIYNQHVSRKDLELIK